ncbi:MAG: hypothetical protein K2O61_03240 [Bacteroidaceae bacterium]|nr:hypothetical protein [Bacteroidaceae bacterium]
MVTAEEENGKQTSLTNEERSTAHCEHSKKQGGKRLHHALRSRDVRRLLPIKWLTEHSPLSRLDRYIIGKFLGTYFFSIILIISIAVVFDINENIDKFLQHDVPVEEIRFDFYMALIPVCCNSWGAGCTFWI